MKRKHLLSIVIACLFVACHYDTDDFVRNAKELNGEVIHADCMIGRPSAILYAEPQKIILYDRYDGNLISIIDMTDGRCARFLQEGNGPEDILPGFRMFISSENQTFGIYQHQMSRLNLYDLADITVANAHPLSARAKIRIEEEPSAANVISAGKYFIGIGMFEQGRIHLYDQQGKYISHGGKYPFKGEDMDSKSRFFAYQSYLASNSSGKFVVGSAYGDNLEFYAVDEHGRIILVKKYGARDVLFSMENLTIRLQDDCMLGYKGAWGGEKYCYLLFSGKSYAENDHRTIGGKYLFVFTWDGQFVKSYRTDRDILSFCADEKNGIIYAIVRHEDDAVMRFALY
ncbi:MAG: TolB-like 6-bladed beta-propeller domain-containing protein [Tannerella sp.]|jgi:hypothetical protein|nr:TolB-like 6-bladed beta-propeller domain-containing protein [Tannerella sp.]